MPRIKLIGRHLMYFGFSVLLLTPVILIEGWMKIVAVVYCAGAITLLIGKVQLAEFRYNYLRDQWRQAITTSLCQVCEHFYQDSPIQNYVVQVTDWRYTVKVGDDDYLVEVDTKLLEQDTVQALEKARQEWFSAKFQD